MIKIIILALAVAAVNCSGDEHPRESNYQTHPPSPSYHEPRPHENYHEPPRKHYPEEPRKHHPEEPKHYPEEPMKHYPEEPKKHYPEPPKNDYEKPRPNTYEVTESPSSDYGEIIQEKDRKPVYNILADATTIHKIRKNLNGYFNGLETNLNFDEKYYPSHTSDNSPCDCNTTCDGETENWNLYANQLRRWTEPENPEYRQELVVLVLKVNITRLDNNGQYLAGQYLAEDIAKLIYKDGVGTSQLVIVLQVRNKKNEPFVRGFLEARQLGKINDQANRKIQNQVGWTFGCHVDSIADTYNFFTQKNVTNLWFSVGRSNCYSVQYPFIRFHKGVQKRLIDVRDVKVRKTLVFTIDRQIDIINVLILEVDAIVTHRVNLVWRVLQEPRFYHQYRLANQKDNPWANADKRPGADQPYENFKVDDDDVNV